jgi:hypothetical protein
MALNKPQLTTFFDVYEVTPKGRTVSQNTIHSVDESIYINTKTTAQTGKMWFF